MPLFVTPRQLSQKAEFYHQIAALIAAGVGLIPALEILHKNPPARSFRHPIARIAEYLNAGSSFSEAMRACGSGWLTVFDGALIRAGEESGRLDVCLRLLASYYEEGSRLARQVISNLLYPALILHLAILIFPTSLLTRLVWQGEVLPFAIAKASILGTLYAVIGVILYLGQARRNSAWRSFMERMLRFIPLLGVARRNLALARLSAALESLLNAGVSIVEAWPMAAAASGSPAFQRAVEAWTPSVAAGQTPAQVIRESALFPDLFASLYSTGEMSGQLDEMLKRLHHHYQEEAFRMLQAIAQWTPRLIYMGVVLLIAFQVVRFWTGYFSQINELTQ